MLPIARHERRLPLLPAAGKAWPLFARRSGRDRAADRSERRGARGDRARVRADRLARVARRAGRVVRHRRPVVPVHGGTRRARDELHGLAPRTPLDAAADPRNGAHRARSAARHRLRLTGGATPFPVAAGHADTGTRGGPPGAASVRHRTSKIAILSPNSGFRPVICACLRRSFAYLARI
ncbi:hypothetical protein BDI4_120238 [Burkholderia diffusa]|nr:hypothetical protein BDI4_120238 [Burkholderia diffusa]